MTSQNIRKDTLWSAMNALERSSGDGWWDWHIGKNPDFSDHYEYMSDRFWQILKQDPSTKKHHPSEWMELIHPDDLKIAFLNFDAHVKSKGSIKYDQVVRYKDPSGGWIIVQCRGEVVEWGLGGEPVRMVGTHTDLTEVYKLREIVKGLDCG